MGKNQGHKQAQMGRGTGGGGNEPEDGKMDASFHSPAYIAAHIASLQATERMTYDDFKAKQAVEAKAQLKVAEEEDRAQLEFRAQLDADRAKRLGRAAGGASGGGDKKEKSKKRKRDKGDKGEKAEKADKKEKAEKGEKGDKKAKKSAKKAQKERDKDKKKHSKKKRRHGSSDSDSDSSSSSSSESRSGDRFRLSNWKHDDDA